MAVFCRYYFSHIICNLAGFRNCLAAYTVHSLSPCYGLLTALVLLNSVAIWCNATQFFTKKCHFTCLCAWALEGIFPGGSLVDFFKSFLRGPNVVKFVFHHLKLRKQHFVLKFSNSCPSSDTHLLVCRKSSCHTTKNLGNFKRFNTFPNS